MPVAPAHHLPDLKIHFPQQAADLLGSCHRLLCQAAHFFCNHGKASPARRRAASMAAFKAKRLVWSEMLRIISVILPISDDLTLSSSTLWWRLPMVTSILPSGLPPEGSLLLLAWKSPLWQPLPHLWTGHDHWFFGPNRQTRWLWQPSALWKHRFLARTENGPVELSGGMAAACTSPISLPRSCCSFLKVSARVPSSSFFFKVIAVVKSPCPIFSAAAAKLNTGLISSSLENTDPKRKATTKSTAPISRACRKFARYRCLPQHTNPALLRTSRCAQLWRKQQTSFVRFLVIKLAGSNTKHPLCHLGAKH